MTDLKLLDGTVEEVNSAIAGLSAEDVAALLEAEKAGKKRKGVLDALEAAHAEQQGSSGVPAAESFAPSGAPEQVVPDVDPSHPSVDADPRANSTETMNRIDFNDPTKSGQEIVEEQLGMAAVAPDAE